MPSRRIRSVAACTGLVLGVTGLLPLTAARAVDSAQPHLVSAVPSTTTPDIDNGTVFALTQVGTRIVAGGTFSSVSPHASSTTFARSDIVAWDAATGTIDQNFAPTVDGEVEDLVPGPLPNTVYAVGMFNNVNGVKAKGVALLDLSNGKMVAGFKPAALNGGVYGARLVNGRLLIGGTFTTVGGAQHQGLATLNATTGALDPYVNVQLVGHHNYTGQAGQANGPVGPRALDVSPDGTRAIVIGNFKTADGLPRDQIVMVDLGATAVVDPTWSTLGYTATCFSGAFDTYMRDVDFSPDGAYFVVAATGGSGTNVDGTNSLCDTAARFETNATGTNIRPTWADWSGQDTIASVAITGSVVYIGGHQRWLNNSHGYDYAGEGAVPRPGLAALDPRTGMPFAWNPGRNPRGAGAFALLATTDGLYVGSDTEWIGNYAYKRKRIAYFPLAGGASATEAATSSLPGKVFLAGGFNGNSNVLYRVDAGGPALMASDGGPDWVADQSDPSPYRNSGSNSASWSPVPNVDATVPAGTPSAIFDSERWDPNDATEMHWSFPVPAGTSVDVRLYFANRCSCTSGVGQRVFNVSIDGTPFLSNFDIVAAVGDQTGTMRDKVLTSDGSVDIDFGHVTENPLINGIEIVKTGTPPGGSGDLDSLRSRSYDGTTVGATQTPATSIAWRHVRGAFEVGNTLFYGWDDGNLYKRSFDGTTFGAATLIDPYDDPAWANVSTGTKDSNNNPVLYRGTKANLYSQLASVTGLAYRDGILYYTLFGDSHLYSRYFMPDSGIVGSDTVTAPGGVDLSHVAGMFLSGNNLYWASKVDGTLHRDAFAAGALSGDTIVSGPAVDGNDWRSRAMWVDSNGSANQPPTARIASTCANLTCSFDGTTSADPDGTIASYAWNFGDGTTSTLAKPSHTYAAAGPYTVTLTVTDDKGATGTATKSVTVTAANQPPTAAISGVSCTGLTCSFDGSGSADADGSITSYAWTFGDGGTASGAKPSHTYGSASTYPVTLTVTDDKGATGTATTSVSPTAQQPAAIGFVGASSANSNQPTKTVTVPAATQAGDALLLLLSKNSTVTTSDPSGTGWVAVDSVTNGSMVTQVWKKVATASDASSTVSITQPGYGQADLELLAYTGTNATDPIESYASAADSLTTASHTTPTAAVTEPGSWAVSYWTDKSSSTTAWTAPASVTTRATSIGTGSGRMTALVADSGGAVSGSSYGGLTATTDQAAARAAAWTFVLAPR
jgi:PKD repeat protein